MKKLLFIVALLLITGLSFSVYAEGLLPGLSDVYGVAMPSLCDILDRYPDSIVDLDNGSTQETFNSVTEEQYGAFGDSLGTAGCEMVESSVEGDMFSATIQKDGKQFQFSYDTTEQVVVITYMNGSYDPAVKDADEVYSDAIRFLENKEYDEAYDKFRSIAGFRDADEYATQAADGISEEQYQTALTLLNEGETKEAYDILQTLSGYKDVDNIITTDSRIIRMLYGDQFKIGDVIVLGQYEQDNDTSNGKEPIEWVIIDEDGDRRLLISCKGLEVRPFNKGESFVTWKNCALRSWLNGEFYKNAFSSEEKKQIASVTNTSEVEDYSVEDKVFVISYDETYLVPWDYRTCEATEYARAKGAKRASEGDRGYSWWTRTLDVRDYTPLKETSHVLVYDGRGYKFGYFFDDDETLVRPSLWIDLNATMPVADTQADTTQNPNDEDSREEMLEKGSKGEDVKRLQQALIDHGYLSGSADGQFGKMTETAVKAAQEALGLEPTGIADAALLDKLYN